MAVQPSKQLYTCLDSSTEGGFINFFKSLPEKPNTTVRIFDRSDYYTVHGEDALLAAKDLYHTNSVIKHVGTGTNTLASVVLSRPNFESFVRDLLLVKQYRIEIFQNKGKKNNVWEVAYKASPGNLQQLEGVLFSQSDAVTSTCVMAIKLTNENGRRMVGVAYAEPSLHKLGVSEFLENDQFSNVEMMLVQLTPKECLLVANDNSSEASKLRHALSRSNVLITERKRTDFSTKDITQDLNRLLKLHAGTTSSALPEVDLKHSMASLAALIKYLELLSDETNFGSYSLTTLDLSQYMRLDSAAVRALNLDPQTGETRSMNLLGLLNKCSTPQGQRLLAQWLKQPLLNKSKIEDRLDMVELLAGEVQLLQALQEEQLKHFPDLFRLSRKLERGKGSLQDCVRIYQAVRQLPGLVALLQDYDGPHKALLTNNFITSLKELEGDFEKFTELVETTIDLDMIEHHEFVIKPSFDEGLAQLRSEMEEAESKANAILRKVANELDLEMHKTVKLSSNEQLGYFLRITKKHEKEIRGQRRFTVLETRNDGVKFTTSSLQGVSHHYCSLKEQYSSAQASVAEEVMTIAAGYAEPMQNFSDIIAQLDVLVSFAAVAMAAPVPYTRPTITPQGEGDIVLVGSRHPCLEVQDEIAFIANDVSLLRGKDMFQIITGPNMGGKSTYIRQIGVIVLMAQVGSFVPCQKATVSIVDCILARVGASDSQVKGVSTFMAEMLETAAILRSATKDSLIIIDELGRGTSTYDGFGLAWAISEHISTKINCFCLFATHFHELTELANEVATVTNRHVTAQMSDETLTLLYNVKPGVCDQSFGIHVAELVHFPQSVIDFAKRKAAELEVFHCYGDNEGEESAPLAKRRKTEAEEGEKIIADFLTHSQELFDCHQRGEVSKDKAEEQFELMKKEVLASDNTYIQSIVSANLREQ